MGGNQALNTNPPSGAEELSTHGSDWLFAVTAVYGASFLIFASWAWFARAGEKIFHYIFTVASLVGTIAYFAMGSDLGYSVITEVNSLSHDGATRQIFWPKYAFWVIEFPSLILALGLVSGISWATIVYQIFLSWIWVVGYLVTAYTTTNYKWGLWTFATAAYFLLACSTLTDGMKGAKRVGITRDYTLLAGWTNFMWLLYPIAFGISDGGNRVGVTGSYVWFGILDILLLPLVGFCFLFLARRWDYGRLNIAFTQYGRVNTEAGTFPEKNAPAAAPAGGVAAGEQAV